jgi:hypothetical protein
LLFLLVLGITSQFQVGEFLLGIGLDGLAVLFFISVLWRFNIWRLSTPKTLRDLLEKKRIYVPDGDANNIYLRFLENYQDVLGSPKRYLLSGFPMIIICIYFASVIVQLLTDAHLNGFVMILVVASCCSLRFSIWADCTVSE